ncbi:hypothetical protein RABR111495_16100 [Rahnella bruchi]
MAYFPISMPRNLKTNYWDQLASLFLYVRFSLSADLQRHVFVCCMPEADFKHLSRPEGGSQSQLISQSERPSQRLSRATQTGQLV